ncbi:hypothetical protein BDFB_011968, partial [Asbolus verrucosus]
FLGSRFLPVQSRQFPEYYHFTPSHRYNPEETGSSVLGFYLGYKLSQLTTPTYSHKSFYDSYRPRYDHYTVHHFYHNKEGIPPRQKIRTNTILGCTGDSTDVCPANTTSLCTSDGTLMCVVTARSTVVCGKDNCVRSVISCLNNTAPECKGTNKNSTLVNIPCISTAEIYGNYRFVNNTIRNDTSNVIATNAQNIDYSTKYPITTTPPPFQSVQTSQRTVQVQEFCIVIVAKPAVRSLTKGEEAFNGASGFVEKFIERAWGL